MKGVYASFAQIDDIVNESVIVLMSSIDKYVIGTTKFETYISKRLRGLIIDLARKQDWIPRNVRKNARIIDDATNELFSRLGRFPTDEEMAQHLGVSLENYQTKMLSKTNLYNLVSLDAFFEGQGNINSIHNIEDNDYTPDQMFETKEMEETLKRGIASLRENEQTVLSLHYRKELSMKEIAGVMGLSESRISQIHANALRKLRVYMQENEK
ncbi:RNA polymerase sigma factor FliA [Clostridiales bacterium]|nr:RNA polymerase sigma factor FliA [Clostridiales bacterium]